jgi:hypothetical protein
MRTMSDRTRVGLLCVSAIALANVASAEDALSHLAYTGVDGFHYTDDDCFLCYGSVSYTVDIPWPDTLHDRPRAEGKFCAPDHERRSLS